MDHSSDFVVVLLHFGNRLLNILESGGVSIKFVYFSRTLPKSVLYELEDCRS